MAEGGFIGDHLNVRAFSPQVAYCVSTDGSKRVAHWEEGRLKDGAVLPSISGPYIAKAEAMLSTSSHVTIFSQPGTELFGARLSVLRRHAEDDAKVVFYQMAMAVKALHSASAVHGWLNTDSFLLATNNSDVHVLLSDFAFRQVMEDDSFIALIRRHIKFGAPEIIQRFKDHIKTADFPASADIWGLGVILYVILSGQYPFGEGVEVLGNIVRARYNWEHQRWKTVSGDAKRFLAKLLVADPQERLTMDQLLQDPWLAGVIVPPVPSGGLDVEALRVPSQIMVKEASILSGEPSTKKAKLEVSSGSALVEKRPREKQESAAAAVAPPQPPAEEEEEGKKQVLEHAPSEEPKKRAKVDAPKPAALKKLKVADLRVKCTELGISSEGTKDQMIARILAQYE